MPPTTPEKKPKELKTANLAFAAFEDILEYEEHLKNIYHILLSIDDTIVIKKPDTLKPEKIPTIKYAKQQFISELRATSTIYRPLISTKDFPTVYATMRSARAFQLE